MTVIDTGNKGRTMDFQAGDVGYINKTLLHYVENTGDTDLVFIEIFKSPHFEDLSFAEWLGHTPPELVAAHLRVDQSALDAMQKTKSLVVPT
jgi:oxalate decarboxylase